MNETVRQALTSPSPRYYPHGQQKEQAHKDLIGDLVKHSQEHQHVCTCLINRVFPDASRHLENPFGTPEERPSYWKNKHLAHPALLDFYAERVMGTEQSALYIAEQALEHIDAPKQLARFLRELDPVVREDAIKALYNFTDDIPESSVVPVCGALLDTLGVLSKRSRSMYELSPRKSMLALVMRLIWKLDSEELRDTAVKSISAGLSTLSSRHALLQWTGYDEKSEDHLISKQATEEMSRTLQADLSAADLSALDGEPDLLWMLTWMNQTRNNGEEPIRIPADSQVACALLRQSRAFERSRGMTTRFVEVKNWIDLESLRIVGGSDQWIREVLRHCSENEGDGEIMEIVPLIERELLKKGTEGTP